MINNRPTQNGLSDIFRRDVKDVYVTVRDNNVDQALRVLKKKMQCLVNIIVSNGDVHVFHIPSKDI